MATKRQVEAAAAAVGLHVAYYNPGDNPSWKFSKSGEQYFAQPSLGEVGRVNGGASSALLWLDGYAAGSDHGQPDSARGALRGERRRLRL